MVFNKRLIAIGGLLLAITFPMQARAETVVEKAARTGAVTLGGRTDIIPYSYIDDKKELVGYSLDVATLIEQEVSRYLGKPVKVKFQPVNELSELIPKVAKGEIDLACNVQFTWEREMFVDFSMPYSLSGIRLLTQKGKLSGEPEALAGKRIAIIPNSLGESTLKLLQPEAVLVPVAGIDEGIVALAAGKVDAMAGDSVVLAGNARRFSDTDFELVPQAPYIRYAVGCIMPENNSTFRNLTNLAIAQLIQGYLVGEAKYSNLVNRWMGPDGILGIPTEIIRDYFETVLLNYEQLPLPNSQTPAQQEKNP
jgi:polar amino acid transport system substrate-binding protein